MPDNFFYHEYNLEGKIRSNYGKKGDVFRKFKLNFYDEYKEKQVLITGIGKEAISNKVLFLANYYKSIDKFLKSKKWITNQSKIRSTIIEKFCGFLFKDLPMLKKLELNFFNKNIYAGIAIDSFGKVIPKRKNVDFCIGKEISADFEGTKRKIIVPIVAIECKTWLDETMFSEAQFTAQKLKQGTPNVKVYILSGYSGIANDEVPSKGQTPIDQIFLIGDTRIKIDKNAVWDFFKEIESVLNRVTENVTINEIGRLLPE